DRLETVPLEILGDAGIDLRADERVVEQCRAHADRGGAGDEELERILRRADAALADDGYLVPAGDFVHLVDLQQGDGLDGRARQSALDVADDRLARVHVDGHAGHGIDHGERIGTRLDAQPGVLPDVRLVGRELGDQRLAGRGPAGGHYARRHLRVVAELHAAFL